MWTDEEIKKLRELWKKKTLPEIASQLGKYQQEVRYQIRKLGLKKPIPEFAMMTRYAEKHGLQKAADHFRVSVSTIKSAAARHVKTVEKIRESLSAEVLTQLRRRAYYYAIKMGRPQHGEDFGSFVVIYRMTHEIIKLDFLWIDYLRQTFGATRTKVGKIKAQGRLKTVPITEEFDPDNPGVQVAGEDPRQHEGELTFIQLAEKFNVKGEERIIFLLHFKWSFSQIDIGELFNVSRSRISQIISEMTLKLKRKLEKENE